MEIKYDERLHKNERVSSAKEFRRDYPNDRRSYPDEKSWGDITKEEQERIIDSVRKEMIDEISPTVSLIRDAYKDGISIDNIAKYLNTGFNAKQIDAILVGFSFDLSVEDVASYADKHLSAESMHDLRRKIYVRLQNEKRHGEKEQYRQFETPYRETKRDEYGEGEQYRYPENPYNGTNRDEYEAGQQYRYPEHPALEKAGANGLDALLKEKKEQVYKQRVQKSKEPERTDRFSMLQ